MTRAAMLRIIVLLSLFVTATLQAAERLTPEQFTARYAEAVEAAYAGSTAEVIGDLEVAIATADERSTRSFLDNAYTNYQADPDGLDDVLQQYVAAVGKMLNPDPGNDLDRLFPVIKHNAYVAEIETMLSQSGQHGDDDPFPFFFEKLNRELVLMYAFDSETGISFASAEDVEAFGIAGPALRARAVENLMNYLPDISVQGDSSLSILTADGNYEASLILVDEIWTRDNFNVAGDIVVFVPARDIVLVTGSKEVEGLAIARELIASREWSYFISDQGFIRTGDGWAVFNNP